MSELSDGGSGFGVRPIRLLGDPVLRQRAKGVLQVDASIQRLIDDMIDSMREASGVGWLRPDGVSLRVVVIEVPGEEVIALSIRRSSSAQANGWDEGCLSPSPHIGRRCRAH
jgi:peptide deformylase